MARINFSTFELLTGSSCKDNKDACHMKLRIAECEEKFNSSENEIFFTGQQKKNMSIETSK